MTRRKSFVFLVCALVLLLACNGSSTSRPVHDELGARVVCQEFVKRRLKAPATAKFELHHVRQVAPLDSGCYTVWGYVDAQNSFGALIRSEYYCSVCSTGERDMYDLKDLRIE